MSDNTSHSTPQAGDPILRICGWMQFKHQETGDVLNAPAIAVFLARPVSWGEKTRMALNSRSPLLEATGNWDEVRHATWVAGRVAEAKKWTPLGFTPNDPSIKPLLVEKIGLLLASNAREMAKKKAPERRIHLCRFDHWLNGWGTDLVWDPLKDLGVHTAPELLKMSQEGLISGDDPEVCEHWLAQPVAQEAKKKAYGSRYPAKEPAAQNPRSSSPADSPPAGRAGLAQAANTATASPKAPAPIPAPAPSPIASRPAAPAAPSSPPQSSADPELSFFDDFPLALENAAPAINQALPASEKPRAAIQPSSPPNDPSPFDDYPTVAELGESPKQPAAGSGHEKLVNAMAPSDEFKSQPPATTAPEAPELDGETLGQEPSASQPSGSASQALPETISPAPLVPSPAAEHRPHQPERQEALGARAEQAAMDAHQDIESDDSLAESIFGGSDLPDFSKIALATGAAIPRRPASAEPSPAPSPAPAATPAPASAAKSGAIDFSFAKFPAHNDAGDIRWETCLLACSGYMPTEAFAVARRFQAGLRDKNGRQEIIYASGVLPALAAAGLPISVDGAAVADKFLSIADGRPKLDAANLLLASMAKSPHSKTANIASLARAKFYRDKIAALFSTAPREPAEEPIAGGWIQLSAGPMRPEATQANPEAGAVRWFKDGVSMAARLSEELDRAKLARLCEGYALALKLCLPAELGADGMLAPGSSAITTHSTPPSIGGKP